MSPLLARLVRPVSVAMAAFLVHGCTDRERDQIPDFVQQMMDADFPADGRIYAWARGNIPVEPASKFCTFRPGWSLNREALDAWLGQMGQSHSNERIQGHAGIDRDCIPGQSIFIRAVPADNREGRPYKMVLAVWRGEAACVAAIERLDGRRPGVREPQGSPFTRVSPQEWQDASLPGDMVDLSRVCIARLSRAG